MSKAVGLSNTQRLVLRTGDIVQWFDVWGGYWWTFGPRQEKVKKATIDALVAKGCIIKGLSERVYSGRQRANYTITESGRLALSTSGRPHPASDKPGEVEG